MGKKLDPPVMDVSARKTVESKTPVAAGSLLKKGDTVPVSQQAASPKAQVRTPPFEEAVRIGAYLRWDAAGRPGGDGVSFWLEAEQELRSGDVPVAGKILRKQ